MAINHKNFYLLHIKNSENISRMYDIARSFIVRATSPEQARKFASECCGDEGSQTWIDPKLSTCKLLTPETGGLGVIMRDFRAG